MSQTENDVLLTYGEVAAFLGIRVGTVYSMVSRRQIPYVRLGRRLVRFSKKRIGDWVDERHVTSAVQNQLDITGGRK